MHGKLKYITSIVVLVLVLLSSTACSGKGNNNNEALSDSAQTQGKITVFTTIFPVYDFAKNIGGQRAEVINLIPVGADPHSWEPSPQDMAKLQQADVFIYCGAGIEPWIDTVLNSFGTTKPLLVDSSIGVELLTGNGHHDHHHNHNVDPHIWLDPLNAQIQVNNITEALIKADPANAEYYRQNQANYSDKLNQLDQEYRQKLASVPNKKFVTSHAAFGYLAKRYGLEQIPLRGLSPEVEPSPARLAEVVRLCRENDISYIFFENLISDKVSNTIAREIGGGTLVLHPLGGITKEQQKQKQDYISLMKENLNNLLIALGDSHE